MILFVAVAARELPIICNEMMGVPASAASLLSTMVQLGDVASAYATCSMDQFSEKMMVMT